MIYLIGTDKGILQTENDKNLQERTLSIGAKNFYILHEYTKGQAQYLKDINEFNYKKLK